MSTYKSYLLIAISFLFGFLGSHTANLVSAHGGDTNLIHSCVNAQSGNIRIVGATENCRASETSLDWSIQGSGGGLSGVETVSAQGPFIAGGSSTVSVNCPTGKLALGGGGQIVSEQGGTITDNQITGREATSNPPTGWSTSFYRAGTAPASLKVYAICANATP